MTGVASADMVPYDLAKIVQYDILQADAPLPAEGAIGLEKHLKMAAIVAGSEKAASKMQDAQLLRAAMNHPCCLNKTLSTLV